MQCTMPKGSHTMEIVFGIEGKRDFGVCNLSEECGGIACGVSVEAPHAQKVGFHPGKQNELDLIWRVMHQFQSVNGAWSTPIQQFQILTTRLVAP